MEENKKNIVVPLVIGGTLVTIVLVAGTIVLTSKSNNSSTNNSTTPTPTSMISSNTTTATTSISSSKYKDGTYSADGNYVSPGGQQQVGVTLTIKDGKITSVTVTPKGQDPQSKQYETLFSQGISDKVVGKSLSDNFNVGQVNGSSLTSTGFINAVNSIKVQAQS